MSEISGGIEMNRYLPFAVGLLNVLITAPLIACTGIFAAHGDLVLAGNNEDWRNPEAKMWFIPAEEGQYGRVCFGFDNFISQGGMNDQGLFYDGFATKPLRVTGSKDKERYAGRLEDKALAECATVDEVLRLFDRYNLEDMSGSMLFFADRTGNSVIIEGDEVIRKPGCYQVVTNFHQSLARPGESPCPRYKIAVDMFARNLEISIDLFRRILAATHLEGSTPTQYSNIYDLKNGIIYLYHFHNFQNEVVVNLEAELAKGAHSYDLASMFPRSYAAEAFRLAKLNEMQQRKAAIAVTIDAGVLDEYVGRYQLPLELHHGKTITISRTDGKLFGRIEKGNLFQLLPTSETVFVYIQIDQDLTFTFVRDEERGVRRVIVEGLGWSSQWRRRSSSSAPMPLRFVR